MDGKIFIVGFGPGAFEHITERAKQVIQESEVVIGYNTYVDLMRGLLTDQEIVRTGMTEEVSRGQKAVNLAAEGKKVAVISSGDAGVYGMAGLIYEVLLEQGWRPGDSPSVEVIPGISAIHSCAALLGAPIMQDACTISLSDHLIPWEVIERRLEAAAAADFVIALYNPKSGRRTRQIAEAQRVLLKYRTPETPVGLVKSAYRERQNIVRATLKNMLEYEIGMLTTVIVGNSSTFYSGNLMITPRGYQRKYTLDAKKQKLRPEERLHPENEPWALHAGFAAKDRVAEDRLTQKPRPALSPRDWAEMAAECVDGGTGSKINLNGSARLFSQSPQALFEIAVSPGVDNKKFTSPQLILLAKLAEEQGEIEYTTAHQLILRTRSNHPDAVVSALQDCGLTVLPTGNVVKVKACDFCDGEKADSIPYASEISRRLAGLSVEKELCIGVNGCAMACYGAVHEDIGLVFRRGKFDLFLGGKTTGRNAAPGIRVAEGIPPEQIAGLLERIVTRYRNEAFPGERFHKFFQRVGELEGFYYQDKLKTIAADSACES